MTDKDLTLTEFSIIELEDRLEFAELCDSNCGCVTGGTNTTCNPEGGSLIDVGSVNAYCGEF